MLFSPVYTCSEPRRVESHPRQFVSPSSRDLCVLSVSALDCSFSLVVSNLQLSTFDSHPSFSPKFFSCNTYGSPRKCWKQETYAPAKPFRCNTYKKHGVGYASHFGKPCTVTATRTRISFKFFLFTFLRTLWHDAKLNSFVFMRFRTLWAKTPGGGGTPILERVHFWQTRRCADRFTKRAGRGA